MMNLIEHLFLLTLFLFLLSNNREGERKMPKSERAPISTRLGVHPSAGPSDRIPITQRLGLIGSGALTSEMRGRPSIAQRLGRAPLPPRLASSHPAPRTYTITHAQHAPGAVSQRRVSRIPVPVAPVTPVLPALAKSDFAPTDTSSGASLAKRYDSIDPAVYAPVFRRGGEKKAEVGVTRVSVATELNPSNAALSSQFSRVFAQPKNLEGVANKVRPSGTIKSKGRGVIAL